jgi:hypothetical protein
MMKPRKVLAMALGAVFLAAVSVRPSLAAGGRIITLNAWGGWAPNTPVDVQATVMADTKISNSNLYYTISLGSTIYATHTTNLSSMSMYETRNDQWETVNSGWPEGDYTITICWSTGNSQNCNIDGPKSVVTHFVPTLGWALTLALVGFLLWIVLSRRRDFAPAVERARR